MHFKAAQLRTERAREGRAWLVWHIAALRRMKRLPKLEEMTGSAKPAAKAQPWQEMRNISRMITVMHGGEIISRDRKSNA